jgi:hypothetical protein
MPPPQVPSLPRPRRRVEMLTAGYTDAEIRAALTGGRLTRLCTGSYVDTDPYAALPSDQQYLVRIRAEALRTPQLIVSHLSAAAVHGLPVVRSRLSLVHFTRQGRGGTRRSGRRWVHVADIPEQFRVTVDGIDLTSVARTIVDVGRTESLQTTVAAADAALQMGLTDPAEIGRALLDAHWHPGSPRARRAIRLVDGRAESAGESLLRIGIGGRGLPDPELQVEIRDEDGRFVARTDMALLAYGILIEFDGHTKYAELLRPGQDVTDVVLAEKRREERLTELGWLVIRVTWHELADPAKLADRIRRACNARRRLVASGGIRGTAIVPPAVTVGI